jgi:hypothetical protein
MQGGKIKIAEEDKGWRKIGCLGRSRVNEESPQGDRRYVKRECSERYKVEKEKLLREILGG